MASVVQIINARDPSVDTGEARVTTLITLATNQTGTIYGTERNTAIALTVLHWLTLSGRGGASGAIASEKEGDLARAYHKPMTDIGFWSSTSWGMELLNLRRMFVFGPRNRTIA